MGAALVATLAACGGSGGDSGVAGPTITSQPHSQNVAEGSNVSFSVSASGASLTYQWYKDGSIVPGAVASTYSVGGVDATDIGSYYAVVSNVGGSTASNVATLKVTGSGGLDGTVK